MELAFDNKKIRQICEDINFAERVLGKKIADKLKSRLADLIASEYVNELIVGQPMEISDSKSALMRIDITNGAYIVFSANHNLLPVLSSGAVDWSKVSRIKILEIQNSL